MTAPDPRLGEIEARAQKFLVANARMIELGYGIGYLAQVEPEMYEDSGEWDDLSNNSHADTALYLLSELRTAREALARVEGLADEHDAESRKRGDIAWVPPSLIRAAVAAADGCGL